MKYLFCLSLLGLFACSGDFDVRPDTGTTSSEPLKPRSGADPKYVLSFLSPGTNVVSMQASPNLWNWDPAVSTSIPGLDGTTSTVYGWPTQKNITIYQHPVGTNQLMYGETDGISWTFPFNTVTNSKSSFLPTVIYNDGVVHAYHVENLIGPTCEKPVLGTWKGAVTWSPVYNLVDDSDHKVVSCTSPSAEYHPSQIVEYLVTGRNVGEGVVYTYVHWKNNQGKYVQTTLPGIHQEAALPNKSVCPVAYQDGRHKLMLFYTPWNSSTIHYKIGGISANYGEGNISSWIGPFTIPGTSTDRKIDGIFEYDSKRLSVVYTNSTTDKISIAYTDDFGANWTIIPDVADSDKAPSITYFQ